jgi:hypothetical protein
MKTKSLTLWPELRSRNSSEHDSVQRFINAVTYLWQWRLLRRSAPRNDRVTGMSLRPRWAEGEAIPSAQASEFFEIDIATVSYLRHRPLQQLPKVMSDL